MKHQCEICGEEDEDKLMARTSFSEGKVLDSRIICLKCFSHKLEKENG